MQVSIREPGFPIASVSHRKQIIVGCNQAFNIGDHDFPKLSFTPDAILIHDIPRVENRDESESDYEEEHGKDKSNLGSWYRGQVIYGIKSMVSEGNTA